MMIDSLFWNGQLMRSDEDGVTTLVGESLLCESVSSSLYHKRVLSSVLFIFVLLKHLARH